MKVTIEAMSFSKMECFFEDVILKQGKEADTTNAVSKAVQKFCRKYRGEGVAVISANLDLNDIVW